MLLVTFSAFSVTYGSEANKWRGVIVMGPCEEEPLAKFSIDLDTHLWQLVEVYQPRLYLFALRLEHHRRHHGPGPDSEHTLCTTCVGETSMVVAAFHDIDLFKIAGRLILLLSCIFLLAACGDSDISQPAQAPVTPTPTTPENRAQQANDVVQGANLAGTNVRVSLSGSVLTISEDLSPYGIGGNGLVIDDIQQGCYDVQKAVWTSSLSKHLSQVKLNITMDTQDQYGKVYHNTLVGYCMLTQKTAALFQWDNLSREDAWTLYDSTWLIPFLTQ